MSSLNLLSIASGVADRLGDATFHPHKAHNKYSKSLSRQYVEMSVGDLGLISIRVQAREDEGVSARSLKAMDIATPAKMDVWMLITADAPSASIRLRVLDNTSSEEIVSRIVNTFTVLRLGASAHVHADEGIRTT